MINIYNLVKSVKKRNLPLSSFNLRIKKAQGAGKEDDAVKWIREEEERRQKQQEQPPQGTIVEDQPNVPVSQPSSDAYKEIYKEKIYYAMDNWIKNLREEMEGEAVYDVETLKAKPFDQSPIQANNGLYLLMKNDPSLQQKLVEMINNNTMVKDPEKASIFVDTMLTKSEGIGQELEENAARVKADEAIEKEKVDKLKRDERRRELAKEKDTYAFADPLPDPLLDQVFDKKWNESSKEEKASVYGLIGNFSQLLEEPSNASRYRFGMPGQGQRIDQRISFFLSYPHHLKNVMDDKLISILSKELPKMGIDVGGGSKIEVMNGIKGVGGEGSVEGVKGRVINILNNEKGSELYSILNQLIVNGSPDIYKWLEPVIKDKFRKNKEFGYDAGPGEDSAGIGNVGLEDTRPPALVQPDIYEEYESSQILGNIAKNHLTPALRKARGAMSTAIGSMSTDSINKFKSAPSAEVKKKALDNYNLSEELHAFTIPLIDHFHNLFEGKGERRGGKSSSDPLVTLYKNKDGRIEIPEDVVKDIYKEIDGEEKELKELGMTVPAHDDYKGLVQRYIYRMNNGTAKPYTPKWSALITHNYPNDIFISMGKLKEEIKKMAKLKNVTLEEGNFGIIKSHFYRPLTEVDKSRKGEKVLTLADFAGVVEGDAKNKGDSDIVKNKKMDDFIYMTLSQTNHHIEWLKKLGSQKPGGNIEAPSPNKAYHNLLSIVGGKYYKLLGYLANKKEDAAHVLKSKELIEKMTNQRYQPTPEEVGMINDAQNYTDEDIKRSKDYTDDSLGIIIGLLDHHGDIRHFLKSGDKVNKVDRKQRTNTELYYSLRGVNPPDHIQTLMDIHKIGLSKSKRVDKQTGQPKLELGSWYHQLFKEYGKFDPVVRGRENTEEALEGVDISEDEHYQKYNQKILRILNDVKKKPVDRVYEARLRNIGKTLGPETMNKVDAEVQGWRNDPTGHLLDNTYTLLGYAKFNEGKIKANLRRKNIMEGYTTEKKKKVPGINDLDEKSKEIKKNLRTILENNQVELAQDGMNIESLLPRLRLAKEAYNRTLIKIAALEKMKKHSYKFASTGCVDYIELQIARVKTEFDHYFKSLFLK